jgi:hypothetical protein
MTAVAPLDQAHADPVAALRRDFEERHRDLQREFKTELAGHAARIRALEGRLADGALAGPAAPTAAAADPGKEATDAPDRRPPSYLALSVRASERPDVLPSDGVTETPTAVNPDERSSEKWSLKESMWDASLLLGRKEDGIGHIVTIWSIIVFLFNAVVQATIALIVVFRMTGASVDPDTVADLRCSSRGSRPQALAALALLRTSQSCAGHSAWTSRTTSEMSTPSLACLSQLGCATKRRASRSRSK